MTHKHQVAAQLLEVLDLGSSIAEQDALLETARVETSAFSDLFLDKVDLRRTRSGETTYWFPYVYRDGLNLTQGRA